MDKILSKEVTFELAKLLKEKRFDKPTRQRYFIAENIDSDMFPFLQEECTLHTWNDYDDSSTSYYSAPTIGEVIDWLYEKYKFWINVEMDYSYSIERIYFYGKVKWFEENYINISTTRSFNLQTEAYNAIIEYCLERI